MAVTIRDIAERTGKSITTVSRALAGYDDVAPETKVLVRQVAVELGYEPNLLAQRLQKQRTDTIGLILPTFGPRFSDPFFSEFLAGVGNRAARSGFDLLVSTQPPGEEEINAYRHKVQGRQVDGFIVVRTRRQDARIDYLRRAGVPFAVFGRADGTLDFPFVDEDGVLGMRLMADHLARLGYRRVACIAPPAELMFAQLRLQGLREGLAEHGVLLEESQIRVSDLTQRGGYAAAQSLLAEARIPDAIAACNDLMALGAMSAAQSRGLVVGQDVAITGFDDIPMAEHSHPPLTTLHQPIYEIAATLTEMLLAIIAGKTPEQSQVILKPHLVIRRSCGSAAQPAQP
ncbi:MAG TPA: LacI family DNA-binding transcriptional regulator [Anaerolineae bacterium]|nr:LacI family DNA-binding transcriptional regulator [Anaerolineae bacterium]HNU04364.1 LacI family DNA-binding transcriptional regulator [Anaerolineae bacterium]